MKKMMLAYLLVSTGNLFAQDINIADLRLVLQTDNVGLSDTRLVDKGFSKGPGVILLENKSAISKASWQYLFKADEKQHVLCTVSLFQETSRSQPMVQLETSDIMLYKKLLNQLPGEGFYYIETGTLYGLPQMHFSNNHEEILAVTATEGNKKSFQLRFQPYSGSADKNVIYKDTVTPRKTAVQPTRATTGYHKKVAKPARKKLARVPRKRLVI